MNEKKSLSQDPRTLRGMSPNKWRYNMNEKGAVPEIFISSIPG